MYKKFIFFFSLFFTCFTFAQQFQNIDLNGVVAASSLPTNWQGVPDTDPVCLASDPQKATVEVTDVSGPLASNGTLGNPYSGSTFVSGLYGFDNTTNVFQEGIMQTVSGFIVGCQYSIKFHQAVVKQDPMNFKDPSGLWRVYVGNTLAGSTAPTTSNAPFNSTSFIWEARTVNFTATATTHTIKFLPMDNDANSSYVDYTKDGGVRMGIDSIYLVPNGPGSGTQNASICAGDTYLLPDGTPVTTAGTYTTIITGGACDAAITTVLTVSTGVTINQSATICLGKTYTLPGGTIVSAAGTYIDTVAATGCDTIITTTLTFSPTPAANQNVSICLGGSYTLPGGGIATAAGAYNDTISLPGGCDSIFTTNVSITPPPTGSQNVSICAGQNYTLPGGAIVNTAGAYIDTIQTTGGCDSIITTTITIGSFFTSTKNPSICAGNSYTLPDGSNVTASGTYIDTIQSTSGCDSIITINLTVNNLPTATVSPNVTIAQGASTPLAATGGATYSWSPSTGLSCTNCANPTATPTQTTTYCVTAIATNGCSDTACVTVSIIDSPCPTPANLDVPNAFSPNADGTNDEFCLQGWSECIENFVVKIYNRWGEKVFESKDPNFCWDGKYRGTIMDAEVFVYTINVKYIKEEKAISKRGNISLIR